MGSHNNVFFEQDGRKMYGIPYGYAIEYVLNHEDGIEHIQLIGMLIMPDDPQNWEQPLPTDIVSEFIFDSAKKRKSVLVELYGVLVHFTEKETLFDIKRCIRQMQRDIIKFKSGLAPDIETFLKNGIYDLIKGMPVH